MWLLRPVNQISSLIPVNFSVNSDLYLPRWQHSCRSFWRLVEGMEPPRAPRTLLWVAWLLLTCVGGRGSSGAWHRLQGWEGPRAGARGPRVPVGTPMSSCLRSPDRRRGRGVLPAGPAGSGAGAGRVAGSPSWLGSQWRSVRANLWPRVQGLPLSRPVGPAPLRRAVSPPQQQSGARPVQVPPEPPGCVPRDSDPSTPSGWGPRGSRGRGGRLPVCTGAPAPLAPGVWPVEPFAGWFLGVALSMFGAVVATVTHWGRREGGAEMWARVSLLPPCARCWLSTRMLG